MGAGLQNHMALCHTASLQQAGETKRQFDAYEKLLAETTMKQHNLERTAVSRFQHEAIVLDKLEIHDRILAENEEKHKGLEQVYTKFAMDVHEKLWGKESKEHDL